MKTRVWLRQGKKNKDKSWSDQGIHDFSVLPRVGECVTLDDREHYRVKTILHRPAGPELLATPLKKSLELHRDETAAPPRRVPRAVPTPAQVLVTEAPWAPSPPLPSARTRMLGNLAETTAPPPFLGKMLQAVARRVGLAHAE